MSKNLVISKDILNIINKYTLPPLNNIKQLKQANDLHLWDFTKTYEFNRFGVGYFKSKLYKQLSSKM
jgi:hypothetical protein